jgi:hypothetical protein
MSEELDRMIAEREEDMRPEQIEALADRCLREVVVRGDGKGRTYEEIRTEPGRAEALDAMKARLIREYTELSQRGLDRLKRIREESRQEEQPTDGA